MASSLGMASAASAAVGDSTPTCRVVSASTSSAGAPLPNVPTRAAAPGRKLIPVWAMVEGGEPVVGGDVHLYSGSGKQRRELALSGSHRTNSQGSVVLRPRRIPADLTVLVRGGRVNGERFPGSLRIRRAGYRTPDILSVNPVTTFAAQYAQAHPEMSLGKAEKRVKRYLEIPDFHDSAVDLRRSDSYFDGDVLLRRLEGRRMDELVRETVALIDRVGRHGTNPYVRGERRQPALKRVAADETQTVLADGESGEAFIAKNLLSGVLSAAGGDIEGAALGFVLSEFGLGGGDSSSAQLAAIQSQLNQISAQLTELEAGVSHIEAELSADEYKTLVAGMDSDQSLIDGAENCLAYVLAMSPNDPDLKTLSTGLSNYIGQKLLTVGDDMQTRLTGNGGLIQASYDATLASATDATNPSFPFFDQADGDVPRNVADFYTGYQAQLAMFVAEYDHVQGLSDDTVTANVNSFGSDVDDVLAQLKPPVPNGTVIDTNTGFLWLTRQSYQCNDGYDGQTINLLVVQQDGQYLEKRLPCGSTVPLEVHNYFAGTPQVMQDQSGNDVQLRQYAPPFGLFYGGDGETQNSPYPLHSASGQQIEDLIQDWAGNKESDSPATFLDNAGDFYLDQTIIWADQTVGALYPNPDAMCFQFFTSQRCSAIDLSTGDKSNSLALEPTDGTAGILWVSNTAAGTFY